YTQQPQKIRKIGFLGLSNLAHPSAQINRQALPHFLRRLGYDEGSNLVIEWRYAEDDLVRLATLATELVRLNVEVIVTTVNATAIAAQRATRTIPIVMVGSIDPIGNRL